MTEEALLFRPSPTALAEPALPVRQLPANIEAEAAFLGAVLIDNRVLEELPVNLVPAHFFEPAHARIFERVVQLLDRKAVVTPVTLRPYFESDETLRELGGLAYLARLTADGQGLLAPRELAEQIYELALLRELVSVGRNLVEGAMDTSEAVAPLEQIEQAEAAPYRPSKRRSIQAAISPARPPGSPRSTRRSAASTIPTLSSLPDVRAWARPRSPPISPSMRRTGCGAICWTASPRKSRLGRPPPSSRLK
jgi:hypothetical protein